MKIKQMRVIFLLCLLLLAGITKTNAQQVLTLERALQYAETRSPDLQQSLLNLERFQKNLKAQKAALKSRFSLDVNPLNFSRNRRFDSRVSEWYINENL